MKTLNPKHLKRRCNVVIRSIDYLRERDLESAFLDVTNRGKRYPLYYQYCQKSRVVEPDALDLIGYVYNIHLDKSNNVVCNVMYNPLLTISANIGDVIDNYVVKINQSNKRRIKYELVRFVVYNKEFKKKVEEKIMNEQETKQTQEDVSVCMEIAAAESIPELNIEAPKATDNK